MIVSAASRLPSIVVLPGDQLVRAVRGDEVDDRRFVLEMAGEIDPALVRLEQRIVVGRRVELGSRSIQRRHAGIASARQIDGREVERQAQQIVAQRAGDELVDMVADLPRHAADDGAGGNVGVDGRIPAVVLELDRVQETLDQADVILVEVRVEAVDRFRQHRVAEAIHHVRELGDDRGIDRDVEAIGNQEGIDLRLDLARELLEHQMLVLHLGDELRRLEQALAVPDQCVYFCLGRRQRGHVDRPAIR